MQRPQASLYYGKIRAFPAVALAFSHINVKCRVLGKLHFKFHYPQRFLGRLAVVKKYGIHAGSAGKSVTRIARFVWGSSITSNLSPLAVTSANGGFPSGRIQIIHHSNGARRLNRRAANFWKIVIFKNLGKPFSFRHERPQQKDLLAQSYFLNRRSA
ncbi:MAG: hypothetical protein ACLUKN_11300 [Bacilli bacterium]